MSLARQISLETARRELKDAEENPREPARCVHPRSPHDLSFLAWQDNEANRRRVQAAQARVHRLEAG